MVRHLYILLFFLLAASAHAQEVKRIEILNADALRSDVSKGKGKEANKLVGNVRLKQEDVILNCDSALFYTKINAVDAFGHVHIEQGDSVDIYSDSLKYNGDKKIADLYSNVTLRQGNAVLTTPRLTYWMDKKMGTYFNGGHLIDKDVDLTSYRGYYYSDTKTAFFKKDVVLKSKDYTLYSDTLSYNTETEISTFYGPTKIVTDTTTIHCESGWYNTKTDIAAFGKNTILESSPQTLFTDSLYYEKVTGFGKALKSFTWIDSSMDIILKGRLAVFKEKEEHITATDQALLIYLLDGDSLYITADTLISNKGIDSIRNLYAFHHVKIFKSDLQGLCDSLFFTFRDSVMWMYRDPILWNEENQLTGDTITMTMRNEKIDQVELKKNGFIVNESDTGIYNQIKGKNIFGYFENSKLDRMLAKGNGESNYYGKDDSGAYMGLNEAICSSMWLYMDSTGVRKVTFLNQPSATFIPMQQIVPKDHLLKGFNWRSAERPLKKEDIMSWLPKEAVISGNKQ
ncbi:MAG: OstA-like protein [Chitinophagales bacterium]|nr:OstA-like protein [Chitinophagales bacterium]